MEEKLLCCVHRVSCQGKPSLRLRGGELAFAWMFMIFAFQYHVAWSSRTVRAERRQYRQCSFRFRTSAAFGSGNIQRNTAVQLPRNASAPMPPKSSQAARRAAKAHANATTQPRSDVTPQQLAGSVPAPDLRMVHISSAEIAQMMEDMRIIGSNVGNLPPGEFGDAMASLHTFITVTLGERERGLPSSRNMRDLQERAIINLVSDLRERRDGRARDIDPRLLDGLIRFEQLRRENREAEEAAGRANILDDLPAPPRELPSSTLPVASQPQAPQPVAGVAHSLGE